MAKLVNSSQTNIHVGTASWISREDLITEEELERRALELQKKVRLKLCIATRLEYMKGVHLVIAALKILQKEMGQDMPDLLILGEGEEHDNLERQVQKNELENNVKFGGMRSYPDSFFETIRAYDLMLLTNLNDEQPRLIFDAISQGLIPICPDSKQFRALNLGDPVYFKQGNVSSLASVIKNVAYLKDYRPVLNALLSCGIESTLDTMHIERRKWISGTIEKRGL